MAISDLGDLFVLLFFGWVGTLGNILFTSQCAPLGYFASCDSSVGLLAVAVLNVNNMRDIISDEASGKNSIPVRLGLERARVYHGAFYWLARS